MANGPNIFQMLLVIIIIIIGVVVDHSNCSQLYGSVSTAEALCHG